MTAKPGTTVDVSSHDSTCAAENFWPHVSIAYSNTAQPATPIVAKIDALRPLPPVEVLVSSLALVELRRKGPAYRWEVVERVGIGV